MTDPTEPPRPAPPAASPSDATPPVPEVAGRAPSIPGALAAPARLEVVLRAMRPTDLEPLRAIYNQIIAAGEAFPEDAPYGAEAFAALLAGKRVVRVAVQVGPAGEAVLGACLIRPNNVGRMAHVANACYLVRTDARGRGVGRALGEDSLHAARAAGFAALQFNAVVETNVASHRLWRSLGFVEVGRVPQAFHHPTLGLVGVSLYHRFL